MSKGDNARPLLITILGIIQILFGAFVLLTAVLTFTGMTVIAGVGAGIVGGAALAIAGLLQLLVGIGFMKGWNIIWYIGVIVWTLSILANVVFLIFGNASSFLSIMVGVVIMGYLFKPNVKSFFLD